MHAERSSFRDPAGQVLESDDGRVFRAIAARAMDDFHAARASAAVRTLVAEGALIAAEPADAGPPELQRLTPPGGALVEHPRLPFVSYACEWPFAALKAAALLHLDVQLRLLEDGLALADASTFNVQFIGTRPTFIDWLSLRRCREGEYWTAHAQFCTQFLHPLLLTALRGVPHHAWLRGRQEGLPGRDLAALLPLRARLSPRLWAHVLLPLRLERRVASRRVLAARMRRRPLPRRAYRGLLLQLRRWIEGLAPRRADTPWGRYSSAASYSERDAQAKAAAVRAFAAAHTPRQIWDLGCASGEFAAAALDAGARTVVGFDNDPGILERAFAHAQKTDRGLLPLYQDLADPTPAQGWHHRERRSLLQRADQAEALLALAVTHHLAIERSIPLPQIAAWLAALAPRGLVEFVPRGDPRTDDLLALRDRDFADYTPAAFEAALGKHATFQRVPMASATGRLLYAFERL